MSYQMPKPTVGEWVLHYHLGSRDPVPAIVKVVGDRALTLHVWPPHGADRELTGVLHRGDPLLKDRVQGSGSWDFNPLMTALRKLVADFAEPDAPVLVGGKAGGKTSAPAVKQ